MIPSISKHLGLSTKRKQCFRIRIGDEGIFSPVYAFTEKEIELGSLIGFTSLLEDERYLVLSKVTSVWIKGNKVTSVNSVPVLHKGDTRKINDLPVPQFRLPLNLIECIFKKEM